MVLAICWSPFKSYFTFELFVEYNKCSREITCSVISQYYQLQNIVVCTYRKLHCLGFMFLSFALYVSSSAVGYLFMSCCALILFFVY